MLTSSRMLNCSVCEVDAKLFAFEGDYRLNFCPGCGVIHLDRVYQDATEFLSDVKNGEEKLEYWGYPEYFKKYKTVFDYFFESRFEKINQGNPVKGTWFDLGAGFGFWMEFLAREKRIKVSGIEIEKNATEFALTRKLDVSCEDFLKFASNEHFSVITMCDVLEHLEHPLVALEKCRNLLLDQGLIYIQVPNVIGLKYPYKDQLGLPHHLWQFDPHSLRVLLEKAGFEVVDYWTGVQGVIGHYERNTAHLPRRFLWKLASFFKRGNRLQMLARRI